MNGDIFPSQFILELKRNFTENFSYNFKNFTFLKQKWKNCNNILANDIIFIFII